MLWKKLHEFNSARMHNNAIDDFSDDWSSVCIAGADVELSADEVFL